MSSSISRELTASHWGVYEVLRTGGCPSGLQALPEDPDPSAIGLAMWEAYQSPLRVQRPAVRASWLRHGPGSAPELRGREPFVELPWDEALDLVAEEIRRVRRERGNEAVFGGSYGWSSAGRFHHAQSQIHRFLNLIGGYVGHVDTYSLGAGKVIIRNVLHQLDDLLNVHHDWNVMEAHTRLLVAFGGVPAKNAQVTPGGSSEHRLRPGLARLAAAGCRFVHVSPVRHDFDAPEGTVEWLPIRPNTDTAAMLALACEVIQASRHDIAFLHRYCVGFEEWAAYLLGKTDGVVKDADWAAPITGLDANRLRALAIELVDHRSIINAAWSLQRAEHGEQPFWAAVGLAAVIGQIGLPGGGVALGYGPINRPGSPHAKFSGPTFSQGRNPIRQFIPCARIADMLLNPGKTYDYDGQHRIYPDIDLIYWAGGNPFHHHQDLNRLAVAWQKPSTIVVHEQVWNAHAKMADIVLPATSTLERNDIGFASREPMMVAMKAALVPPGEAKDDYEIFSELSKRLDSFAEFTEGRSSDEWLRHIYERSVEKAKADDVALPDFDAFWDAGYAHLKNPKSGPVVMLSEFRQNPDACRLDTPSGRIEIYSSKIASYQYADCPGHPVWLEPREWLGSDTAKRFPLHMLSDQPHTKLHSQLDHSAYSLANKVSGREPVRMHPKDASERGIQDGDIVKIFNARGACLAGARLDDGLLPGVVQLATGAWWDPSRDRSDAMDRHGNPNVLTQDTGSSALSQGCSAQSCLVQIERFQDDAQPHCAFELPPFLSREQAMLPDSTHSR